ncbi:hypothetical protein GCM10022214_78140 [Actinomadura miaoliensis]|uniref:Uncharacterized protein n=1 Tax=Actinomadura miaoliensis TaxID=430685 RepID=A0ABP7WZT6_9ACTN
MDHPLSRFGNLDHSRDKNSSEEDGPVLHKEREDRLHCGDQGERRSIGSRRSGPSLSLIDITRLLLLTTVAQTNEQTLLLLTVAITQHLAAFAREVVEVVAVAQVEQDVLEVAGARAEDPRRAAAQGDGGDGG